MAALANPRLLLAVAVLGSIAVGGVAGGSASQPAGNPPTPTTENHPPSPGANFTVVPDDHRPGVSTAYTMLSKGADPWNGSAGLQKIDHYKITTQATRFRDCSPNDAQAFGIDRRNDAPGTRTDEALLKHMESYAVAGRVIAVDIYEESDLAGSPTFLNDTDETVARLANCVVTPSEPGWYQFTGYVNGTNYEGQFQEVRLYSNYFYICDCASRTEARERLGAPPHSETSESNTGTATPAATPASRASPSATVTPQPTTTATGTATRTATPTTPVPTATVSRERDTAATASETATATRSARPGRGTAREPTATGGGGVGTGNESTGPAAPETDRNADQLRTPTVGDGAGFGPLPGLCGLCLGVLAARQYRAP